MIEITRLASASGALTKRIRLADDGSLISDGSACVMGRGSARRLALADVDAFAVELGKLDTNEAIALGALNSDLPDHVEIATRKRCAEMNGARSPGLIASIAGNIAYRANAPAFALIDIDTKGMPSAVEDQIQGHGSFWAALVYAPPELADVTRVIRASTSSGIIRADTGAPVKGSDGLHIYLHVQDGTDIERFLRTLHDRCWLARLGWLMLGAGGQLLERSLIDRTVSAAERLVFEAAPILEPSLRQDLGRREASITMGVAADTRQICGPLTILEKGSLAALKARARLSVGGPADAARADFVAAHAARIASSTGCSPGDATRTAERLAAGVLLPTVALTFDAEEMAGATVAEVLREPERFVGATLSDPLEGVEYGRCKAKIMRRPDGSLWINSFSHGRTAYEIRHDAASIEAAIRAKPKEVVDLFVRLLLSADLAPDEDLLLREQVRTIAGVKARPLDARIKAARKAQADAQIEAAASRRDAERTDPRPAITAPLPDAERLPIMRLLDDALTASTLPVPPMRDLDGHPVHVRNRPPMLLHELTSEAPSPNTRLPAPSLPLLTRHDRYTLAHEIEQHIEFTEKTRAVALPSTFVDHYMAFGDSRLPRVGAIVTAPLVMPDGALLAASGLDRVRKLVFQIEPRLRETLPAAADCTQTAAGRSLDYLVGQWLCDVATDFAGKCVLIALALTILERVLLPERPAFFVNAGKRGGGKTTAIMMIILAVTGKKPAAAAWSSKEDERRKAIFSYLSEGLPAMVWDNIPLGTSITCPTLERVLTAESYSDRVLGESATKIVPAFTVMTFTGNNVGPKGDMASRSLVARLEVDRIDPENRTFAHADPVAWTLDNRGTILQALYTILLANPQLRAGHRPRKTRFKSWWHLVGSAVEHAAAALETPINFAKLFAVVEGDDEDGHALGDVLTILDSEWPDLAFQSSEVAALATAQDEDGEVLRAFFEPTRQSVMSSKGVGKRLMSVLGAPVWAGDHTLMLTRLSEDSKRATRFKVKRVQKPG